MDLPKPQPAGGLRCPKCSKDTLKQVDTELVCTNCGYKQIISRQ